MHRRWHPLWEHGHSQALPKSLTWFNLWDGSAQLYSICPPSPCKIKLISLQQATSLYALYGGMRYLAALHQVIIAIWIASGFSIIHNLFFPFLFKEIYFRCDIVRLWQIASFLLKMTAAYNNHNVMVSVCLFFCLVYSLVTFA